MEKNNTKEKTEDGKLILAFDEKYITPATIDKKIINWDLLEKRTLEIEKNLNTVFSLDNGISHVSDLRKEIANSRTQLDDFRKKVKKHLETDSNKLNKKFVDYIGRYEKVRLYLYSLEQDYEKKAIEEKRNKIQEIKTKLSELLELKSLSKYIIDNTKWDNKTFKLTEIEKEIENQINELNKKYKFILAQLAACNEEIETKIVFDDIESKFESSYDEILKYLLEKKNQIKTTEENMLKKTEKDKQKAIEEADQKAREEEREKIKKNNKSYELAEEVRRPVQKERTDDDYVTLQIKILKRDSETAKLLKQFFEENFIEYEKI